MFTVNAVYYTHIYRNSSRPSYINTRILFSSRNEINVCRSSFNGVTPDWATPTYSNSIGFAIRRARVNGNNKKKIKKTKPVNKRHTSRILSRRPSIRCYQLGETRIGGGMEQYCNILSGLPTQYLNA